MSSLADALMEPRSMSPVSSLHDVDDVEMKPAHEDEEEMDDLFGNDADVEMARPANHLSPSASGNESEGLTLQEREQRRALEYNEEDQPAETVEVKEAEVAFPNLPMPQSSDGDNWVIRIPNYFRVDSKPFHPETYVGPEQEDAEFQTAESLREKSNLIKLRVDSTIRWRWTKDEHGNDVRRSNARVIRWSDGTRSLKLGKEIFDINQSIDTSGGVPRQLFGGSQSSQSQSQAVPITPGGKSQGLTYVVAQHKRSQVLQAESVVTGYMTLRPTGMQSEAHRMLVKAVGQKHNKVARLMMAPDPVKDPEREKMDLIKQNAKKSRKKAAEDGLGGSRKRRRRTHNDFSDDEEAVFGVGSDDDEDDSLSRSAARKSTDKDKGGDYQEDDFVVADETDDEDTEPGSKRRNRQEAVEEDPLDVMDARIEQRRKGQGNGDDGMDLESEEEDDEEFKVQPAGSKKVRRKAPVYEDDDEDDE